MNYLLVDAEKETVDVEFTYANASNDEKTRTVGSVPVQRNYRTSIYGNLLTSNVDINVEIKPEYNEPAHELDALHKAALNGGTITLTEDVELTTPLEVVSNLVIDLNGKTITGAYSKSEGAIIKNNSSLKLVGGTISSTGANGCSAIANYGELVVEKIGDKWKAWIYKIENGATVKKLVLDDTYINNLSEAQLNQIELYIGTKDGNSKCGMAITDITVEQIQSGNAYTNYAQFNAGDELQIDCCNNRIYLNNQLFNDIDMGSDFIELASGHNTIKVVSDDSNIHATVLFNERYL
jgi:phage-related protein